MKNIIIAALLLASCAAFSGANPPPAPTDEALTLNYRQPAKDWMADALPIGNGRLGAMAFGGVECERLQFNEDSLWIGDEEDTGAYQAFGDVHIDLGNTGAPVLAIAQCTSQCTGGQPIQVDQTVEKSFDGSVDNKWCLEHRNKPVVWVGDYVNPVAISAYAFTSAEDMPDRDPKAWTLEGSADGKTWVMLDKHADELPYPQRHQRKLYTFNNAQKFPHYRFTFSDFSSASHFQLAEIELGRKGDVGFGATAPATPNYTNYTRKLDISRAIQTVAYEQNGVHFQREYFASHPANVMVFHLTADKPGAYTGNIALTDMHKGKIAVQGNRLTVTGSLAGYQTSREWFDPNSKEKFDIALYYESQVLVLHDGGTVEAADGHINFSKANSLTILVNAGTDYVADHTKGWRGENPHERITRQLDAAAGQSVKSLRAAHVKDYGNLFGRTQLNLGFTPAAQRDLPMYERMLSYQGGAYDPELEALVFQFGRYLNISCSRDGLPTNLQGLWCNSNDPPWRGDFHNDVNIEMNYWPADVTNLSECFEPFFRWVQSFRAGRTRQTKAAFNARGWTMRGESGAFGGSTWLWVPGSSAWHCQNLWSHYAFTQDKAYLKELYPVLKEICEFWEDRLKTLPDGTLVAPSDFSPEHGPYEDGISFDQELVWDLFGNYVEASTILNVDPEYRAKIAAMRDKLLTPKIGKWGQLQEWMTDMDDPNEKHRHTSHLVGLYPGRQISPRSTPALAEGAKVSLIHRGDDSTGWALVWRISLWARLLDGEHCYKLLRHFIHPTREHNISNDTGGGLYPNLFDACPPLAIDGNFGYPAGVAEMLLQSQTKAGDGYEIELLPALPKAWAPKGSFTGLKARGDYTVDCAWTDGKATDFHVRAGKNATFGKVKVRVNGEVKEMAPE